MCYYNGIKVTKLEYIELMQMEKDIKKFITSDMTLVNGFNYGDYPIIKPLDGAKDFEIKLAHWEFLWMFKRIYDLEEAIKQALYFKNFRDKLE